jgi:signal peptidase II
VSESDPGSAAGASRRHVLIAVAVAVGWIVVDQLTKSWAVDALADGETIDVTGSLRFNLAFNTGASFSMGAGLGPLFSVLVVVVVVLLLRHARHISDPVGLVAVGMVVGGAVGNLLDRVFRAGDGFLQGGVVDFVDVGWWPIFNVADIGVVVGAILLVISSWVHADVDEPAASRGD